LAVQGYGTTGAQGVWALAYSPRLNMAIPSPASERMEMDLATTAGMEMCHLQPPYATR